VEALEPSAGTVVRVVYDHTGCPGPCTRIVQESTAGSQTWHTLLRIPAVLPQSQGVTAQVIRQGTSVIYVPVYGNLASGAGTQHTVIFRSTDGGDSWQRLAGSCGGTGQAVHDAAAPRGFLAALCLPRTGTGPAFALTSGDYGSSWSPPRLVPGGTRHHLSLIAAASPRHLVLATGAATGSGPFAYRLVASSDGGLHWTAPITGTTRINPRAPGAFFLGFEDPTTGRWISDAHHIWTTRDGGLRWLRRAFP